MNEQNNLYKISKKTIYRVLIAHSIFIILLAIQFHSFKKNKPHKLIVNHVIETPKEIFTQKDVVVKNSTVKAKDTLAVKPKIKDKKIPPKKAETPKKISLNKINEKKPVDTKQIEKKEITKSNNYESLITTLEKQINEIDSRKVSQSTKEELIIPKNIKSLNVDKIIENIDYQSPATLKDLLVKELQENLNLPEYGAVKVSFMVLPNGEIQDVQILDHESYENQKYLKNSLSELSFTSIKKMFNEPQKFIVIFRNE